MLTLTITRDDLDRLGACADGLAMFDQLKTGQDDVRALRNLKPRRALRLRWGLLEQVWIAVSYPEFAGWLLDVGIVPPVYGRRADLYGANLDGANLYGANFTRADLARANLARANLEGANLYGANLARADLYGANLARADLESANLEGADLESANLARADLRRANLEGVIAPTAFEAPPGWAIDVLACGCCVRIRRAK
jgi:hypothetical protein